MKSQECSTTRVELIFDKLRHMVLVVFRHKSVKPDDEWRSLQEKLYVNQKY